jgi:hypothetical protein
MFSVFGKDQLDVVNTNSRSIDIIEWKRSPKTERCSRNLFRKIRGEEVSYMARIFEKVWPKMEASEELAAFAISVCKLMLNTKNETIQVNEMNTRKNIEKNKVIIRSTSKY